MKRKIPMAVNISKEGFALARNLMNVGFTEQRSLTGKMFRKPKV